MRFSTQLAAVCGRATAAEPAGVAGEGGGAEGGGRPTRDVLAAADDLAGSITALDDAARLACAGPSDDLLRPPMPSVGQREQVSAE